MIDIELFRKVIKNNNIHYLSAKENFLYEIIQVLYDTVIDREKRLLESGIEFNSIFDEDDNDSCGVIEADIYWWR